MAGPQKTGPGSGYQQEVTRELGMAQVWALGGDAGPPIRT